MGDNNGLFSFYDAPVDECITLGDEITGKIKNLKKIKDITVFEKRYLDEKLKELEEDGLEDPLYVLEDLLSKIRKEEGVSREDAEVIVTFVDTKEDEKPAKTKGFGNKKAKGGLTNKQIKELRDKYIGDLARYSKIIVEYNNIRKFHQAFSIIRYRLIPTVDGYENLTELDRIMLTDKFLSDKGQGLIDLLADFWEKEATHWVEQGKEQQEGTRKEAIEIIVDVPK